MALPAKIIMRHVVKSSSSAVQQLSSGSRLIYYDSQKLLVLSLSDESSNDIQEDNFVLL